MEEEVEKILAIVGSFNNMYFSKHNNIIYKRSKFNQQIQELDEMYDFVTHLYRLAQMCNYS